MCITGGSNERQSERRHVGAAAPAVEVELIETNRPESSPTLSEEECEGVRGRDKQMREPRLIGPRRPDRRGCPVGKFECVPSAGYRLCAGAGAGLQDEQSSDGRKH